MLRKCRSPDITAFEEFWGRLKNEMFYDCSWTGVSAEQFKEALDDFINETRINLSRGGMSLVEFRRNLGLL